MIARRDVLGAAGFAAAAGAVSLTAFALRERQRIVPPGREAVLGTLPATVGRWRLAPPRDDVVAPVEIDGAFAEAIQIYQRVVAVDYVAGSDDRMMVNLAYKREVRQEERFHWPEFCYATQGYDVLRQPAQTVNAAGLRIARFVARSVERTELVGYFLRVGTTTLMSSGQLRRALFHDSLALEVPDGILVRASTLVSDDDPAQQPIGWARVAQFLGAMTDEVRGPLRSMLTA